MRVLLYISYDGSKFKGFARQPNKNTVLDKIIHVFSVLNINTIPTGSGRTDFGVHALNQTLHVDLPLFWRDLKKLQIILNKSLHPYIHVKKIIHISSNIHARFSAKKRLYRYICYHNNYNPNMSDFALFIDELNIEQLKQDIKLFEGEHDFGFFKKNGTFTKSDRRVIYKTNIYRYKNYTVFSFLGSGFLRSQIRIMMNSLLNNDKDRGKNIIEQLNKIKKTYSMPVPACGLYLSRVYYDFLSTH